MQSWGTMPMNEIDVWKRRQCDLVFTGNRMLGRPLSKCLPPAGVAAKGSAKGGKQAANPNLVDNTLPLISIMAATTTRKVHNPSTTNLALFTYLLPSVIRSLDCGYRYEYVLGYDKGDPFYDSEEVRRAVLFIDATGINSITVLHSITLIDIFVLVHGRAWRRCATGSSGTWRNPWPRTAYG